VVTRSLYPPIVRRPSTPSRWAKLTRQTAPQQRISIDGRLVRISYYKRGMASRRGPQSAIGAGDGAAIHREFHGSSGICLRQLPTSQGMACGNVPITSTNPSIVRCK
jgi:hypothetical protein